MQKSQKKSILLFTCLLLLFTAIACTIKDSRVNSNLGDFSFLDSSSLDEILDHYVDQGLYPFIYARLENLDGELIYEHSSVNGNLIAQKEVDGNTWIRIWSMSKIVTISVALDLVEDGLMNLDDPVSDYIPEFKNMPVAISDSGKFLNEYGWGDRNEVCPIRLIPNDSIMSIRHLINHEAGFYYATTGFECLDSLIAEQNLPKAQNSEDLIRRLSKLPLVQHSGTDYFYGTNTTVLGLVAERATGKSLDELVKERVTQPMKIDGLQYGLPEGEELISKFTGRDSILRLANKGELDIFGPDVPDYDPAHRLFLGGEGMLATADGYADFVRMLLRKGELNGHRFLNVESVENIYAPHTQLDNPYGYNGFNLWISGDSMRIKEQGDAGLWIGGGYESTHFWADPKRNFVGVIMSQNNEVQAPGYEMNDKFRGVLYNQIFEHENDR